MHRLLTLRVRRRRGRGMPLGGLFPMVAACFFGAIALALTTLGAGGVGVPVPGGLASGPGLAVADYPAVAVYVAVAAFLALAAGCAIRMAWTPQLQAARPSDRACADLPARAERATGYRDYRRGR